MMDIEEWIECPICFIHIHYTQWDNHYKREHEKKLEGTEHGTT